MKPTKKILAHEGVRRFICWLGALYIRLAHATSRWQVVGGEIPQKLWDSGQPFILAFWHGRLLMMPYCWNREVSIHTLISHHRDGQILARIVSHFGIKTIAGSASRGGTAALRAMLAALKNGECIGITPDGPRGPRMRATEGIINLARLSGVPVVPVAFSIRRGKFLSTWDRFLVAWPFSSGVLIWGAPVAVARQASDESVEAARMAVESSLNAITEKADGLCGRQTPVPAALNDEVPAALNDKVPAALDDKEPAALNDKVPAALDDKEPAP